MSSDTFTYSVIIIALIAVLTFGARFVPFALFSRGGRPPAVIQYLGNVLPPAVMVLLIVYCLKAVSITSGNHGLPEFVSIAAVVLLYKVFKNNLLAIVGGTGLYMFFIQTAFFGA
ncbi:branched-chain amino acid transporter permease [Clostridium aminobutyricum]|uniref:AzlD domain-containing protein n=1 Tax=Clostridium aminobutyricum TaxID=33953 RepID=A0A939D8J8_CLOAM|nr:AzlD domain-containing protein [Clostridium aminobutyricum]MBN7773454.1 AzlD domain-containing protein [Clostridium aminobutyricum]